MFSEYYEGPKDGIGFNAPILALNYGQNAVSLSLGDRRVSRDMIYIRMRKMSGISGLLAVLGWAGQEVKEEYGATAVNLKNGMSKRVSTFQRCMSNSEIGNDMGLCYRSGPIPRK